jgi:hypothetical protein
LFAKVRLNSDAQKRMSGRLSRESKHPKKETGRKVSRFQQVHDRTFKLCVGDENWKWSTLFLSSSPAWKIVPFVVVFRSSFPAVCTSLKPIQKLGARTSLFRLLKDVEIVRRVIVMPFGKKTRNCSWMQWTLTNFEPDNDDAGSRFSIATYRDGESVRKMYL